MFETRRFEGELGESPFAHCNPKKRPKGGGQGGPIPILVWGKFLEKKTPGAPRVPTDDLRRVLENPYSVHWGEGW